jgi:tetratricopeptide (TPR) repeat protein
MEELLATAVQMHQAGQMSLAAQLYQEVLAQEQTNADALHLLGVLLHQQREHRRAVDLIGRAVAARPDVPNFRANLAEAHRALGQFEQAAECCRTALRLRPKYPEALCRLGLALQGLRRCEEAANAFRSALQLQPGLATARSNLGIVLRELGRQDEALEHFRRAVELDPASALNRTNLGQMLVDGGKAEDALPHCMEAVRLQPDRAVLHHNLANVLRVLNQFAEARAACLEALRLDPNMAVAHAHLALIIEEEGRHPDALPSLKRATELEPKNASFWESLAELYGLLDKYADAIPCWERMLALTSDDRPAPRISFGWALQEEGRLEEAEQQFEKVVAQHPDSAAAHVNLGGIHEERGDMEQAEACFRASIRIQPEFPMGHARLATLLRKRLPDTDLAAIEERLADPQLSDENRARLLFGLSQVCDARARYDRAAECAREANTLVLKQARPHRKFVPAEHERFIGGLIQFFDAAYFSKTAGAGLDTRRPVFIVGLPRSGTTLIEQVLASHPRVHGAGELQLGRRSFESFLAIFKQLEPSPGDRQFPPMESLRSLSDQHMNKLRALDLDRADRVVDKMPDNFLRLGLLSTLFPQAIVIHCRRELRDVALSCYMTDFRSVRWANDPEHIGSYVRQYRRLMTHWQAVLPTPIHDVDYEESVADLEAVARRLLDVCGLDWHPACLEFYRTQRTVRTASVTQVRQPVYRHSVARWRNYETLLPELFAALPSGEERPSSG